jgi:sec-independent protein translocase protein TatA
MRYRARRAHEEVTMPFNLGGPELVFVLVIVLIVFGAGKLPTVFGQLGKGVRTFREESSKDDITGTPTATAAATAAGKYCSSCGKPNSDGAKFCASCGTPLAA